MPRISIGGDHDEIPAFGRAVYGLSQWGDAVGGVTINNEREQDLLEVVKRAAGYLRTKIA